MAIKRVRSNSLPEQMDIWDFLNAGIDYNVDFLTRLYAIGNNSTSGRGTTAFAPTTDPHKLKVWVLKGILQEKIQRVILLIHQQSANNQDNSRSKAQLLLAELNTNIETKLMQVDGQWGDFTASQLLEEVRTPLIDQLAACITEYINTQFSAVQ